MNSLLAAAVFVLSTPMHAQTPKGTKPPQEKPSISDQGSYQFIPFVASNKNMWQHGMLMDVKTGNLWLIESQSSGKPKDSDQVHPDIVVAIPVVFQMPDTEQILPYSPGDVSAFLRLMADAQEKKLKEKSAAPK